MLAITVVVAVAGCGPREAPAPQATTSPAPASSPIAAPPRKPLTEPQFPRFEDFAAVSTDRFETGHQSIWFSTPSGLMCNLSENVTCRGQIPGAPDGANAVGVRPDGSAWFSRTADPLPEPTPPVLAPGSKLTFGSTDCVVGPDALTACRVRGEPEVGFVVRADSTALTPVPGLPARFPDPRGYVFDTTTDYVTGTGPREIAANFAVDGGLTCSITSFSGVDAGCEGPMPGRSDTAVHLDVMRNVAWSVGEPAAPPVVEHLHLDQGRAVGSRDPAGWCIALFGGGVACSNDGGQGFVITTTESWSFP